MGGSTVCMHNYVHVHVYYIAGYFRGVYISQISKLLRFAELKNHTHISSTVTSRVQSLQKFSFHKIYTPQK